MFFLLAIKKRNIQSVDIFFVIWCTCRLKSLWTSNWRAYRHCQMIVCIMYTYLHKQNYHHTLCHTDNHCHNSIELCKHADCEGNDWVTKGSWLYCEKEHYRIFSKHFKAWCNSMGKCGWKANTNFLLNRISWGNLPVPCEPPTHQDLLQILLFLTQPPILTIKNLYISNWNIQCLLNLLKLV